MKRSKKKIILFLVTGALIAGMGMSLSMGLAIGSFTSALFGGDGESGVSSQNKSSVVDHGKPAAVTKSVRKALHETGKKESAAVSPGLSSAAAPAAKTPERKGAAPDNLWVDWSPEKVLRQLNSWPGVPYAPPIGAFADPDPDNWQPTYPALADRNTIRNMFAGASFVPGGSDSPFSYSGGGSFSSGGGSLSANDREPAGTIEPQTPVSTPVPPSILLLGSGIFGLLGFVKRFKNKPNSND